jgi:hypothetical protein
MNVIRAALGFLDGLWSLLTIPCLLLAGILLITYLPIPTLIVMCIWISHNFWNIGFYGRANNFVEDKEFLRIQVKYLVSGIILIIATVVSYIFWINYIIQHNMLCEDWSGRVPLNLPWIIQHFVSYTC